MGGYGMVLFLDAQITSDFRANPLAIGTAAISVAIETLFSTQI